MSAGPTQSQRLLFLTLMIMTILEEDLGSVSMEKDSGADLEASGRSHCFLCTWSSRLNVIKLMQR